MSVVGNWKLSMETPFGVQTPSLAIKHEGGAYSGTLTGDAGTTPLEQLNVDGTSMSFSAMVSTPMGQFSVAFRATADGNTLKGEYETMMGTTEFSGARE
ncbi:MAG TPA: hypothetical protein VI565_11210 [Burkholderiales bacterium]|nr:hypothetical protein [Burkholderiales bacterium]